MIERLLEDWLTNANERSFQIPFAHALASQRYKVLHVSRHCAMELGKDIIAIAPDGVPCAYQLKGAAGRNITLSKWRDELAKQISPLVHGALVHPSLDASKHCHHHRSYIVVNGGFDEEVLREIDDFNRANVASKQPERKLEIIGFGELFQMFKDLEDDFWANNLYDVKTYLEVYLGGGRGQLPKEKVARLLETALPFETEKGRRPPKALVKRSLAGSAIICAAAISEFTKEANHVAEFEAWTLYYCSVLGLAERWAIPLTEIGAPLTLGSEAAYSSLVRLCDEMMGRKNFVEGDLLVDFTVVRARTTQLAGLMGVFGLLSLERRNRGEEIDDAKIRFAQGFCDRFGPTAVVWGESAIPSFLASNFFRRSYDPSVATDGVYASIVRTIISRNIPNAKHGLPNPYYDIDASLEIELQFRSPPEEDVFAGKAYFLEGVLHLFVRGNWKQEVASMLPDVTRIGFTEFCPAELWQWYRYRNGETGTLRTRFMQPPHRWGSLRAEANEDQGNDLPSLVKGNPLMYLAILLVMPYRVSAGGLRWVASAIDEKIQRNELSV